MSNELLPCPFCGEEVEVLEHSNRFTVRCKNKKCFLRSFWYKKDELTEVWNTRFFDKDVLYAIERNKPKRLDRDGSVSFENALLKLDGDRSVLTIYKQSADDLENTARDLLKLAEEIRNKEKFSKNESFYYVCEDGYVACGKFNYFDVNVQACVFLGNVFKTEVEAEAHKEEIMARFKEARKKYIQCASKSSDLEEETPSDYIQPCFRG